MAQFAWLEANIQQPQSPMVPTRGPTFKQLTLCSCPPQSDGMPVLAMRNRVGRHTIAHARKRVSENGQGQTHKHVIVGLESCLVFFEKLKLRQEGRTLQRVSLTMKQKREQSPGFHFGHKDTQRSFWSQICGQVRTRKYSFPTVIVGHGVTAQCMS